MLIIAPECRMTQLKVRSQVSDIELTPSWALVQNTALPVKISCTCDPHFPISSGMLI